VSTVKTFVQTEQKLIKYLANKYARKVLSPVDPEFEEFFQELVQEGSLYLMEREETYNPEKGDHCTFCFKMVQYGMSLHIKRRFKERREEQHRLSQPQEEIVYDPRLDRQTDCARLPKMLKELPAESRAVVLGKYRDYGYLSAYARANNISRQRAHQLANKSLQLLIRLRR
jgi:RNA polymerase sigma factor (sigma-70 family)